jgi:hypothetical protein
MSKNAYCARCGRDMAMRIPDNSPHPTCADCLDYEMGRWTLMQKLNLALLALATVGFVALAFLLRP